MPDARFNADEPLGAIPRLKPDASACRLTPPQSPLDYYLQPCARCRSGKYVVDYTEVIGESRRRVLCCRSCRHHPPVSVWVVPLSSSPARTTKPRGPT